MKTAIIAALALAAAPAWADLPRGEWKIARPISLMPRKAGPEDYYLQLDDAALAVESLSEYRIVRDGRTEVPYRMVAEEGRTETEAIPAKIVSQATLRKSRAEVVLDLATPGRSANRLRLRLTGDNFRAKVRVEGSNDQRQWWLLTADGLVYRHEKRIEQTGVTTPPVQYRYLRITVSRLQGDLPAVERVEVLRATTIPRRLVEVPAKMTLREDARRHQTIIRLDFGTGPRDLGEVRFEVKEAAFDRPVTFESAGTVNGHAAGYQGSAGLRRLAASQRVVLPLYIPCARHLRLTIDNGDDQPLTIRSATLWRVARGLVFRADPSGKYELWYGRSHAPAPVYDIQRLPLTRPPSALALASLGPERRMPLKPPPPPPWSERHPALFWGALAGALILLAIVILRTMRGAKAAGPPA